MNYLYFSFVDFAAVCQQSTDFHFPDLDTQLRVIQQHAVQANTLRRTRKAEKLSQDGKYKLKTLGVFLRIFSFCSFGFLIFWGTLMYEWV